MKNIRIVTALLMCISFTANAQEKEPELLLPHLQWDMHSSRGVNLTLKSPTELGRLNNPDYWVKPSSDSIKVDMYVTSPKDWGYGPNNYRHSEFVYKILQSGYTLCPWWVAIQGYMSIEEQNEPLRFAVPMSEAIHSKSMILFPAVGPNKKESRRHDLFLLPIRKGDYRAKWVFVKFR